MNKTKIPKAKFSKAPSEPELRRFWMDVYIANASRDFALQDDDDNPLGCDEAADCAVAELLMRCSG